MKHTHNTYIYIYIYKLILHIRVGIMGIYIPTYITSAYTNICLPITPMFSTQNGSVFKNLYPHSPDSLYSYSQKTTPTITANLPPLTLWKPDLNLPWTILCTVLLI